VIDVRSTQYASGLPAFFHGRDEGALDQFASSLAGTSPRRARHAYLRDTSPRDTLEGQYHVDGGVHETRRLRGRVQGEIPCL
jgi:hypothetical protein